MRTVDFAGQPLGFAEDVEVLPNGEYVVSESVFGGLWLIGRDGTVRPGLVPDDPARRCRSSGGCPFLPIRTTGRRPAVRAAGDFAPGAGSLAVRGDELYISSTCQGGVQKLKIKTLLDSRARPPSAPRRSRRSRSASTTSRA